MITQHNLTCRLKTWHRNTDGRLVLEGTPVRVFGLTDDGMVYVRAMAYVYEGAIYCAADGSSKFDAPNVDMHLCFEVDPDNLVYDGYGRRTYNPEA